MKICIVSDLHCKHRMDTTSLTETTLISNKKRKPANQHPVAAFLVALSKDPRIKADILLCPGDLGDKADEQGIISSWEFLDEIRCAIGAEIMIAIPGNHDVKSRSANNDAFDFIKNFRENFPISNIDLNHKFWEKGYCFFAFGSTILLLVNTVADHRDAAMADKSMLSQTTLEDIKTDLEKMDFSAYEYKICMLHHHPIKHSNIQNYTDADSLENGDELINELAKYNFNIVVHGHKHQPRIVEINGLPIFASGTFSSFANILSTGIDQMFHVIELIPDSKKGIIETWEFDISNGWTQKLNINFPPRIGFGATADIDEIADRINTIFTENDRKPIIFTEIYSKIDALNHLIPLKLINLDNILKYKYKIQTIPSLPLNPNIITEIIL